jgi:hypothetical protein
MPPIIKRRRGRPNKYGRPSRALTVTLPDDVIGRLMAIDGDIGRAIVAVTERRLPRRRRAVPPAELSSYGRHAVIVVLAMKALKRLPGIQLVPIGNGRALIALAEERSISQFELELRDVLDSRDVNGAERHSLELIARILRQARRSSRVSVKERKIIVLESRKPADRRRFN